MYDEYDALDELLEEAYLEGYYDSMDDMDDYYSEKVYTHDDLRKMSMKDLKKLHKKEEKRYKIGKAISTTLGAVGLSTIPSSISAQRHKNSLMKNNNIYGDNADYVKSMANNTHKMNALVGGTSAIGAGLSGKYAYNRYKNINSIKDAIDYKKDEKARKEKEEAEAMKVYVYKPVSSNTNEKSKSKKNKKTFW